jgi:hypothetical protein
VSIVHPLCFFRQKLEERKLLVKVVARSKFRWSDERDNDVESRDEMRQSTRGDCIVVWPKVYGYSPTRRRE